MSADPSPEFVERMGSALTHAGLPRVPSLVFSALLTDDDGRMTAAELASRLDLSAGSISGAVRYLEQVGITRTRQLAGRDAIEIYEEMCAKTGRRLDPCLLDTVMSAVEQADGGPARPWWDYTAERKRRLSGQSRRLTR